MLMLLGRCPQLVDLVYHQPLIALRDVMPEGVTGKAAT